MTSTIPQLNLDIILRDRLGTDRETIVEFCKRCKITEFSLFGSVLRDDFRQAGEDPSDIDVLVVFAPQNGWNLFDTMNMQRELEALFQRTVDFIFKENLENPYRRAEILGTYRVVYTAEFNIASA
jgi:uncharacterized protein